MVKVNNKIDQSFSESGFYEKLYCFFNRYSKRIYIGLGLVLLLTFTLIFSKIYFDVRLAKIQHDCTNLKDSVSRMSFAKKYKRHPIGGLVLLDLGNEAFHGKNYELASSCYSLANEALNGTELAAHSEILHAISLFNLGKCEESFSIFDRIIHSKSTEEYSRSEAIYRYICCAKESGRGDKIDEIVRYSKGLNISKGWVERIEAELD
ncbi:MAG: hypothetical protein LBB15_02690 [Puniceicoccales bacterium]|jgi:tetratricopeptide (TPR) repeat protein|nr:hypothetical protein [Puniceicoccales bacterium]